MSTRQMAAVAVLAVIAACAVPRPATAQEAAKEQAEPSATPLFNGNDLSGWTDALDNASGWQVVDGVIEGHGGETGSPAFWQPTGRTSSISGFGCNSTAARPEAERGSSCAGRRPRKT
jgi:hypothetical protein